MAFQSLTTLQKNKVYAPIITGVAIIVAIAATMPAYNAYSEADLELITAENTRNETELKLKKLESQAAKIADSNTPLAQNVAKISQDFDTSKILETVMVNTFTTGNAALAARTPMIAIENITLDKGSKEPSGIYRGTVNMTVKASSTEMLVKYLDYLTKNTNFYFSLTEISLPVENAASNAEVSLPVRLGVYYYPQNS